MAARNPIHPRQKTRRSRGASATLLPALFFAASTRCEADGTITPQLGAFEGSVVRTGNDPVLLLKAADVTDEELLCPSYPPHDDAAPKTPTTPTISIPGGCGAPVEAWVSVMLRGIRETNGAAIAAPQVGISKRVVIMSVARERVEEEPPRSNATATPHPPVVLVNPVVWPVDEGDTEEVWETCLSVPGEKVVARRHRAVHYRAQRMDGRWMSGTAHGRIALTLQHEVDHLDGVMMTDVAVEDFGSDRKPRADGLTPVISTDHWDLMDHPEYDIRTASISAFS